MTPEQNIIIRQQAEINRLDAENARLVTMLRNMGVNPSDGNALPVTPTPVQPVQPVQPVVQVQTAQPIKKGFFDGLLGRQ